MDQALELLPVNVPMIEVSIEHPLVALNHTKFGHNSGKIADHDSSLSQANHRLTHVLSPISCTPVERTMKYYMKNQNYIQKKEINEKIKEEITHPKRLLKSTIVGNIFTLGQFSIHIKTQFVDFIS